MHLTLPTRLARLPAALLLILAIASAAHAIENKGIVRRTARLTGALDNLQIDGGSRIPADIMRQAQGIIVLQQYEAGFVFGGKGGYGIAVLRDENGEWGPPAWLRTGEGSWGIQIGVQKLNVAFLLMNRNAIKMLTKTKFRIGVDVGATFGPDGTNLEAKFGSESPILVYAIAEGLYAGASFEGGFLLPDRKSNEATYGAEHSVAEITSGDVVEIPDVLRPLIDKLKALEKSER